MSTVDVAPATPSPLNSIAAEQNAPHQLERLAAQRELYSSAKTIFSVYSLLAGPGAAAWAVAELRWPLSTPYALAWGLGLSLIDLAWLQAWQSRLRHVAARVQESFDCELFHLPWQAVKAGAPVEFDVVAEHARAYTKREPSLNSLRDWYPPEFAVLPLLAARVACQLVNIGWDARQRRNYAVSILTIVLLLGASVVALEIRQHARVDSVITAVVGPLAPALVLFIRQYRENTEAAARLAALDEHGQMLWEKVLGDTPDRELTELSRNLQDEIFEHRSRNVPVYDWFYRLFRQDNEQIMSNGASARVDAWRRRRK